MQYIRSCMSHTCTDETAAVQAQTDDEASGLMVEAHVLGEGEPRKGGRCDGDNVSEVGNGDECTRLVRNRFENIPPLAFDSYDVRRINVARGCTNAASLSKWTF